jgi:putative transcriptional regulator
MSVLAPGLLIAAPPLDDPNFDRSVVLLASHGKNGAFGWVINGERVMSLSELATHTGLAYDAQRSGGQSSVAQSSTSIYVGGPVGREQVWLLYRTEERLDAVPDQFDVGFGITASPSQKVLEAVLQGRAPKSLRGVIGFAGWEPSQLEREIGRGSWLPMDAQASLVFDVSLDQMWAQAYQRAGTSPMAFTTRVVGQA